MAALLELLDISKSFLQKRAGSREVRAVAGVSLAVARGETLGLVGESGCGKSTLARLALRLIEPTSGRILFDGNDITALAGPKMTAVRRRLQAVFQDPFASLNPRMTIAEILHEPFEVHGLLKMTDVPAKSHELLTGVGLENIDLNKRPPQFSGGQLQRIAIARALALAPDLIVADEPTSALDPSIQAQIVNLLLDIQRERRISYFVISHDLDVVGHISDRIAVMYLGSIIEQGPAQAIMEQPLHPYAQALLSASPTLAARKTSQSQRIILPGDPPNPADVPRGCAFHPRCSFAADICRRDRPMLAPAYATDHLVACHFAPEKTAARGHEIANARRGRPIIQKEQHA